MNGQDRTIIAYDVIIGILTYVYRAGQRSFLSDAEGIHRWLEEIRLSLPQCAHFTNDEIDEAFIRLEHETLLRRKQNDSPYVIIQPDIEIQFILNSQIPLERAGLGKEELQNLVITFGTKLKYWI